MCPKDFAQQGLDSSNSMHATGVRNSESVGCLLSFTMGFRRYDYVALPGSQFRERPPNKLILNSYFSILNYQDCAFCIARALYFTKGDRLRKIISESYEQYFTLYGGSQYD